jgi:RNA polymerase sigma-70 factor (ECF subfamily)
VVETYTALIYSIVHKKLSLIGSQEDINECVSDVFMVFYQQLDRINLDKGSIKAYLAMISNNKGVDMYRKLSQIYRRTVDLEEGVNEYQDRTINLEQIVIQKEEKQELLGLIHKLGEPDREIFIRKYYLGQKTKEIAKELQLLENTVDKKISRGLKKLRFMLGGAPYDETNELLSK